MSSANQNGARVGLEGEAVSETRRIPRIARCLGAGGEWLLTGPAPKRLADARLEEPGGPYPRSAGALLAALPRVPAISYIQTNTPREVLMDPYADG